MIRPVAALLADRSGVLGPLRRAEALLALTPRSLSLLALRLALAVPFFKSGLTKWHGFPPRLSEGTIYLFSEELKLHILGREIAYPWPLAAATISGLAEVVLPVLLVLGLSTRFAAAGLLVMTAIIQLTVPDGWANFHLPWAAMALTLVAFGPGSIALDRFIFRSV